MMTKSSKQSNGFWSYRRLKVLEFHPSGALRWWLLIILLVALAVDQFQRFVIGSLLVYVFKDFQVGLAQYGVIGIIQAVVSMAGSFLISNAADRYSRRRLIIYLILADIMISTFIALSRSFTQIGIGLILGGTVAAGFIPTLSAIIRDLSPRVGRAFAYAFFTMAMASGVILSTSVASAVIPVWPGWRPEFWLGAAASAATLVIFVLFYRELAKTPNEPGLMSGAEGATGGGPVFSPREADRHGRRIYRDRRIWFLSLAMLCWGVIYGIFVCYLPTFLTQYHGIKPQTASAMASLFWLIYAPASLFSGWISDRWQVRKTPAAAGAIATGGLFLVLSQLPKGAAPSAITVILALLGFCASLFSPAFSALFSENAEEVSPYGVARAFGILGIMGTAGGGLHSLAVPFTVSHYGWNAWIGFCAFLCLLMAALVAFGRGPWRRRPGIGLDKSLKIMKDALDSKSGER